jgi:hypothetical protein
LFLFLNLDHLSWHQGSDINIFNSLKEPSRHGQVGFAEMLQPELQEMFQPELQEMLQPELQETLQPEIQEPWLSYQYRYFHPDDVPWIVGSVTWSLMLAAMDVACQGSASEQDVELR